MLRRVVPIDTILRDVRTEVVEGNLTYGRHLASYPLLVGIPSKVKTGIFLDILVTGHGMRSITGIPYPLEINTSSQSLIGQLPRVGKKRAQKIIGGRPYRNLEDFAARVEKGRELANYITI
jgi:radical SAM superfamily enzyme with C-terminal helix-hairpin-helix motif